MENKIARQAVTIAAIAIVSVALLLAFYLAEQLIYDRYSPVVQAKGHLDCLISCGSIDWSKVEGQVGHPVERPSCSEVCGTYKPRE